MHPGATLTLTGCELVSSAPGNLPSQLRSSLQKHGLGMLEQMKYSSSEEKPAFHPQLGLAEKEALNAVRNFRLIDVLHSQ